MPGPAEPALAFHRAAATAIDVATLYAILRLRVDVFVVEQECLYPELDGRDLEPDAELLWASEGDAVLATLRILRDKDAARIGRVATSVAARGRGIGAELMRRAVDRCGQRWPRHPIDIDAQAHLAGWYARFGFTVCGAEFVEDGILHLPMRRAGGNAAADASLTRT